MRKFSVFVLLPFFLFILNGCNLDNFDFKKLSKDIDLNPEFIVPIGKANISVYDLIKAANSDSLISTDSNGVVNIIYTQNDLYKYDVADFLDIPDQQNFSSAERVLGEISFEDIQVSREISLNDCVNSFNGQLDGIKAYDGQTVTFPEFAYSGAAVQFNLNSISDFKTATISKGTLEITMENKLKVPVKIAGNLFDLGYNHKIADFNFGTIQPNNFGKTTVSLQGIEISGLAELRLVTFETPGSSSPVLVDLNDYFNLNFKLTDLSISKGNLIVEAQTLTNQTDVFNMVFPEPDFKAFSAVLKKGTVSIKTTNNSNLSGSVNLVLPEIKKNGVPVTVVIPLNGSTTTVDLSGANFNFTADPEQTYNRIPYTYSVQLNTSGGYVDYSSTDLIKLDVSLKNLDYRSIQGDFGNRQIAIDPGEFDMDVELLDKIKGNFNLANPKIELIIRNSIGMPASVKMNFNAFSSTGATVALNPPLIDIPVPATISSGIATKSYTFDKQNSNVVNFIALPPSGRIAYNGQVDFNTNTTVTAQNPNFLDFDLAFMAIDMVVELPLELQVKNLEFKDTTSISGGDYTDIESADLILNTKNGIPLDVEMQLFFIDTVSNQQFGSSKKMKIISAALVDLTGVITPVEASQTFSLDAAEMENLRKSNGVVLTGTVNSPSGGTGVAKVMSDSKLDINMVIKSKINL